MQLVFSFSTCSNWPFGVNTRGCGQVKNVDIFQNLYLFQEAYLFICKLYIYIAVSEKF